MNKLVAYGRVVYGYELAKLTTFKIGGPAKAVVWVKDERQLEDLIGYLDYIACPYWILGNGSNVLVPDEGLEGVVIKLNHQEVNIKRQSDYIILEVSAGMKISKLLNLCVKQGIGGLEFLAGIPGTIGGAIAVNAGAMGHSIGERVEQVTLFSPTKGLYQRSWNEQQYGYRQANLQSGEVVLKAKLIGQPTPSYQVWSQIKHYFIMKKQNQPLFLPSAGCVFKNPPGLSAGRLIDEAGLKGKQVGEAFISEKHANFIINKGQARAQDVLDLMEIVKETVEQKKGIVLEPEIRLLT